MSEHRCNCQHLKQVIFGKEPSQRDGLLYVGMATADIVHGPKENPGGLVKEVADLRKEVADLQRWRWMIVGGFTALNLVIQFWPKIESALK
jgi:hypothetical protein